ncbi:DUF3516 domain-containing protein [Myxococcota bacterium]|nr:DUF3516 domain-containing protein [Myxococcota bacterium]
MSASPDTRLDERIPDHGFASPDDALLCFLEWVADQGITPWPHQEEALIELFSGRHVVLDTPTGSGKSLVALGQHFKTFAGVSDAGQPVRQLGRTWYTAPIKALVSEKFFALCKVFGAEHVGMMTGDGAINRDAPIMCCTAEILANLALREGAQAKVDSVVMDEFHYYADRDRGMAWQLPLLTLPQAQFLLMSATLGDTQHIRDDLEARTGRGASLVGSAKRPVPLEFRYSKRPLHETIDTLVRGGNAPVYVVHFTQRDASEQAQALTSVNYCTREEKDALIRAVKGFRFDSPFGKHVQRYVQHGIGLHHAGLLPRYRLLVEKLAQQGLLKVICGTDTLGVGINVPIRTVLFTQLCKYDGQKVDHLRRRDFKQIAGRAGRAGFDDLGLVVAQAPAHVIENALMEERVTDPAKRRKIRKAQPPQKGFKHWDEDTFRLMVEQPPERLESRFSVDHGRLLTLMQQAEEKGGDARRGVDDLLALIRESHATDAEKVKLAAQVQELLGGLLGAGLCREQDGRLRLDPGLQHDFSLYHSLSLFLVEALDSLDPASLTFHLDALTWVEAILENPMPVLVRQADRERGLLVSELKAAGVPYEDRMDALEDVTWPKPMAEQIYAFFNAYDDKHPWVSGESIRPKAVARDMVEGYRAFADYVKELGIERSEGVLLRYLTEVYKALVQNVPERLRTDAVLDVIAYLRALLGRVDSSLITEWETLLLGGDAPQADAAPRPVDISLDKRAFAARVRAELHLLVRALSLQDWEAAASLRQDDDSPWTPETIQAAVQPFLDELGPVAFDHRARQPLHTRITPAGPCTPASRPPAPTSGPCARPCCPRWAASTATQTPPASRRQTPTRRRRLGHRGPHRPARRHQPGRPAGRAAGHRGVGEGAVRARRARQVACPAHGSGFLSTQVSSCRLSTRRPWSVPLSRTAGSLSPS